MKDFCQKWRDNLPFIRTLRSCDIVTGSLPIRTRCWLRTRRIQEVLISESWVGMWFETWNGSGNQHFSFLITRIKDRITYQGLHSRIALYFLMRTRLCFFGYHFWSGWHWYVSDPAEFLLHLGWRRVSESGQRGVGQRPINIALTSVDPLNVPEKAENWKMDWLHNQCQT